MDNGKIYLLLYSANLAFIVTNLYGWIVKEFHTVKPYREHLAALFPAQRFVGALYLAQLMEIPYLLMLGQREALFYVNAFSTLYFSVMVVLVGDGYFFFRKYKVWQLILYFLPMCVVVGWLLLAALGAVRATPALYQWMFWVVCLLFLFYMAKAAILQKKILRNANDALEGHNADDEGFPVSLSFTTRWLLIPTPLLMFVCFLCNDVYVKMGRDILFTLVNVWFLYYTIKPHRKAVSEAEVEAAVPASLLESHEPITDDEPEREATIAPLHHSDIAEEAMPAVVRRTPKYKLSPERYRELEQQITDKLTNEKIFQNPALTIESLAQQIDSNKNYVSEAINRGQFGSYYALINHFRVEHAVVMLKEDPKQKIENVSKASGFSSISLFSQVFKRIYGVSPMQFVRHLSSQTEEE